MKSVHLLVVLAVLSSGVLIGSCASADQPGEAEGLNADPCTGAEVSFVEAEPNNGTTEADHNVVETEEGDLIITGSSASCGNDGTNWTGDMDVFEVSYGCGGLADVALTWGAAVDDSAGDDDDSAALADLDYNILAPQLSTTHYAAIGYNWDPTLPNEEKTSGVELAGPLRVSVMCWSGEAVENWVFTITWDDSSVTGDDDDSSAQ